MRIHVDLTREEVVELIKRVPEPIKEKIRDSICDDNMNEMAIEYGYLTCYHESGASTKPCGLRFAGRMPLIKHVMFEHVPIQVEIRVGPAVKMVRYWYIPSWFMDEIQVK